MGTYMRTGSSALLPLLRSRVQGELLALLYLHPEHEYTLTDIAARVHASVKSVHQEANRLSESGLVQERRIGNARLLRADLDHPLARHLTGLMLVSYGPLPVLSEGLSRLEGVTEAYLYGSWAARYRGEVGPQPDDIDVLIVGKVDRDALYDVTEEASRILERDVNAHVVSASAWRVDPPADPFLVHVRQRPLVAIDLIR